MRFLKFAILSKILLRFLGFSEHFTKNLMNFSKKIFPGFLFLLNYFQQNKINTRKNIFYFTQMYGEICEYFQILHSENMYMRFLYNISREIISVFILKEL